MSDSKVSHAHQSKEYKEGKLKAYEKYSWISVYTSKFKIFLYYTYAVAKLPASVKVLH